VVHDYESGRETIRFEEVLGVAVTRAHLGIEEVMTAATQFFEHGENHCFPYAYATGRVIGEDEPNHSDPFATRLSQEGF
jgi:hypothetical protein